MGPLKYQKCFTNIQAFLKLPPSEMATIQELEKEIDAIKERNRRVETEKSWETSWTRRITIDEEIMVEICPQRLV